MTGAAKEAACAEWGAVAVVMEEVSAVVMVL